MASTDRSETRPVAPLVAADVVIQPWLAVDPGQGWERLVAGVIPAAEEDVGGLAMREKFLGPVVEASADVARPRQNYMLNSLWNYAYQN